MDSASAHRYWLARLKGKGGSADATARFTPPSLAETAAPTPPLEAAVLGAPIQRIARGGMGEIFRARQPELERDIAHKRVRPEQDTAAARASFLAEAVATGTLSHPNIVPVYGLGKTGDGAPCLAMKLLHGKTWKQLLRALPDDLERHLEILLQVCHAVAYAHSRGILHNDLKPENVMVGDFGEVTLLDWGLAVRVDEAPACGSRVRHRSAVREPAGTPAYMPPELARGDGAALGPASDVYLLGGALYELASGKPPRTGASLTEALAAAVEGRLPPFGADFPAGLRVICERALAAAPAARYPDVQSFAEALRAFQRRRQSRRLCARAREDLERCGVDEGTGASRYAGYAECIAAFDAARQLWPENPAAHAGEIRARLAYAEAARGARDFGLARAQLARAGEGAEAERCRAALAADTAAEERERSARRRLRLALRIATAACFLALAGGLVTLLGARATLAEQGVRLEEERAGAVAARLHAEERERTAERTLVTVSERVTSGVLARLGYDGGHDVVVALVGEAIDGWRTLAAIGDGTDPRPALRAQLQYAELQRRVWGGVDTAVVASRDVVEGFAALLAATPQPDDALRCDHIRAQLELGLALLQSGALAAADTALVAALQDARALIDDRPTAAHREPLNDLLRAHAEVLRRQGRLDQALAQLRESQVLIEGIADPLVATNHQLLTLQHLTHVLLARGEIREAEAVNQELRALHREHLQRDPDNATLRSEHALAQLAGVRIALALDRDTEARALSEAALATLTELARHDPYNLGRGSELAAARFEWGRTLGFWGEYAAAAEVFAETYEELVALRALFPESGDVLSSVVFVGTALLDMYLLSGDYASVDALTEQLLASADELTTRDPEHYGPRLSHAYALTTTAERSLRQGRLREAQERVERALHLFDNLLVEAIPAGDLERTRGNTLRLAGEIAAASGEGDPRACFEAACALHRTALLHEPDNSIAREDLIRDLHRFGEWAYAQGDLDLVAELYAELEGLVREALAKVGLSPVLRQEWALTLTKLVQVHAARGELDALRAVLDEARELNGALREERPENPQWLLNLFSLAQVTGRLAPTPEAAVTAYETLLAHAEALEALRLRDFPPGALLEAALIELVEARRRAGDFAGAIEAQRRLVGLERRMSGALFTLARLELLRDDRAAAEELLRAALEVPGDPPRSELAVWLAAAEGSTEGLAAHVGEPGILGLAIAYARGELSAEELVAAARRPAVPAQGPLLEAIAWGTIGLFADLAGDREGAVEAYRACLRGPPSVLYVRWARDRLRRWGE